jgi:3-isopropylmalate/(R)-2-methylmalate dehydratase small subunit
LPPDIDTDQLAPGHAMKHGLDTIARHCLEGIRPEFAQQVKPGDVIVAGPNFGIGSSREQAASVLVHLGVAAVIAPNYAGLFHRNAFNVGLLLLTCPDAARIEDGEAITFDAHSGHVRRAGGEVLGCKPISKLLLDLVEDGGLMNQLKRRMETKA